MTESIEVIDDLWEKRSYAFRWHPPKDGEVDILDEISQVVLISQAVGPE